MIFNIVQNLSSTVVYRELIAKALGITFAEGDRFLEQIEIYQPTPRKQFWQSTNAKPGIYIVVESKVRLLDRTNNLFTTIKTGTVFGEKTIFFNRFQLYAARASVNVKLGYLSTRLLKELDDKYLSVREHLPIIKII